MYKVILVDDEPFALEGLKLTVEWEELGFEIAGMCENGEEAFAVIEACQPELVVTDIRMPVIDGLELIDRVQKAGCDPVFIIVSGYNDFEYARSAIRYGVKHYLLKPALDKEWENVMQSVIGELQHREQQRVRQDLVSDYFVPTLLAQMLRGEISAADGNVGEILDSLACGNPGWRYIHLEWLSGSKQELDAHYFQTRKAYAIDLFRSQDGLVMESFPELEAWAQHVYEDLYRQGIECCFSMGPRVASLRQIADSYAGALETSVHHFFHVSGGPLDYHKINQKQISYDLDAYAIVDDIQHAIEALQEKRAQELVKIMFEMFTDNKTAREVVHLLVIRIVLKSASVIREMGIDSEAMPRVRDFLRKEHRSLKEVETSLQTYVKQYMSQLKLHKEKFSGHPLRVIERYIQEHYREPLTIKDIGERFFLNPVYLGQAFMKRNGVGIIEHIHDLRIDEAKRRLCESDETIRLIAEQVGYVHYHHFLKEFEKRVSDKPAAYRELSKA
ncbi:response regulator transcription factor [Paenibacillus whitsoniae]|uniref:Response regulator n=1 Tax=Paenibacillus whitsoniae TaxID=2496558 RepID=A0A430JGL5_9BACL|nr:response regulator [Paenibacillus whitsoniae]RTE10179.1 response regulator [Paenibacillus whitsoniae]